MHKIVNRKVLTLLLMVGAVYFFLRFLVPVFAPVLTAMLFVTVFGPLLKKAQKVIRLPRQIGAILILVLGAGIVTGLLWILIGWIVNNLSLWMTSFPALQDGTGELEALLGRINPENLRSLLGGSMKYVGKVASVGGFLITFLIASILLAKDYDPIMNHLLEREEFHLLLEIICGVIRFIATFLKAQAVILLCIGGLCAGALTLLGISHGYLWGILAGLLDALPFIGTGVVLGPMALAQFLTGAYTKGVLCLVLYVGCILLREFMEPKLIGRHLGISPIAVLAAVYGGIQLFGASGILKGPLGYVILKEAYERLNREENEKE